MWRNKATFIRLGDNWLKLIKWNDSVGNKSILELCRTLSNCLYRSLWGKNPGKSRENWSKRAFSQAYLLIRAISDRQKGRRSFPLKEAKLCQNPLTFVYRCFDDTATLLRIAFSSLLLFALYWRVGVMTLQSIRSKIW